MKTMTAEEWNITTEFLETAPEGAWAENEHWGRIVTVENMCGGRYMCRERNWETNQYEMCGLVDTEWQALHFLDTGKII